MLCSKCGNVVKDGSKFCSYCGNNLTNNNPNQIVPNNYFNQTIQNNNPNQMIANNYPNQAVPNNYPNQIVQNKSNNKAGMSKGQKAIILSLLIIFLITSIIAIIFILKDSKKIHERSGDGSRTIMIYMAGNNLESDNRIASSEIEAIDPDEVDLDKVNVLLYTGGTEKWHNFIENDENAIYQLTEDGFEKIKEYDKKNMGDYKTFLNFLNYGYENYDTQYYDLILYDHGGAIQGAVYDEFTDDNLSLADFDKALKESKFNSENKLNTVLFRTCLNGTIEVATTFAPYANYLISSEEVTNGKTGESVLKFLNEVDETDDEISYGKKFIKAYEEQMDNIDPFKTSSSSMYSIVDLSKVEKINDLFDEFISGIDLKSNYKDIVRIRSNMYQYGYSTYNDRNFDTVDLYTLVSKLSKYSSEDSEELLSAIDDAVVHNWSDLKDSNGLSVYFPYNGKEEVQQASLNIYRGFGTSNAYYKFINQFNGASTSKNFSSFSKSDLTQNETVVDGQEFSLQLTEEQKEDYAQSIYIVFRKTENGLYNPIYSSDNTELTDSGLLKTHISNNLIKLYDKTDPTDKGEYLLIIDRKREDKRLLRTTGVLHNYKPGMPLEEITTISTTVYFEIDNGVPKIVNYIHDDEDAASGTVLNAEDYSFIDFSATSYEILDENGNYTGDWESNGKLTFYELYLDQIGLKLANLGEDEEYYCVFKVQDIYGNVYYSKLLNIN